MYLFIGETMGLDKLKSWVKRDCKENGFLITGIFFVVCVICIFGVFWEITGKIPFIGW
jgi:hypothetical protein